MMEYNNSDPLPVGTWIRFMRGGKLVIAKIEYVYPAPVCGLGDWKYMTDNEGEVYSSNVLESR